MKPTQHLGYIMSDSVRYNSRSRVSEEQNAESEATTGAMPGQSDVDTVSHLKLVLANLRMSN